MATQIRNSNWQPIGLPHPFRGVLPKGGTFLTRMSAKRVRWHLDRGSNPYALELQTKTVDFADFDKSASAIATVEHSPPIDESFGAVTSQDDVTAKIIWQGPADDHGALILADQAVYRVNLSVVGRRIDLSGADYARFERILTVQLDTAKNTLNIDKLGVDAQSDPGFALAVGFSATNPLEIEVSVTGAKGKILAWASQVEMLQVGG